MKKRNNKLNMANKKNEELIINTPTYTDSNQSLYSNNSSINSFVVYTLIKDCCLKCWSFDQIIELIDNASAKKSTSSESDNTFDDFLDRKSVV